MARVPPGEPPPPTVQRVWLRYAKRGRLRFTSHRDFARALERALRRAGVPMAYSAGFSPHPKVSYVGATPTGVASEAEYLELGLAAEVDLEQLRMRLDAALPAGLDVLAVVASQGGSLADRIEASWWELRLPGVARDRATSALTRLVAADSVPVERLTKNGVRIVDVRAALVRGRVESETARLCAILSLVVRHVTPAVRPDDVLAGLRQVADLVPPVPAEALRRAQGLLDEAGRIADPLSADRGQPVDVAVQSSSAPWVRQSSAVPNGAGTRQPR